MKFKLYCGLKDHLKHALTLDAIVVGGIGAGALAGLNRVGLTVQVETFRLRDGAQPLHRPGGGDQRLRCGGSDADLVICLAYIIQVQSAAWYVRFTQMFGNRDSKPQAA